MQASTGGAAPQRAVERRDRAGGAGSLEVDGLFGENSGGTGRAAPARMVAPMQLTGMHSPPP